MPELHPDFRVVADATLAELTTSYPAAGPVRIEVYEPSAGDRSLGSSDRPGVIALNGFWFAEPRAKFDAAVIRARDATPSGAPLWHGGIGGPDEEFKRLIVHEFGHHVKGALADGFAREGHAAAIAEPVLAVSGYALADPDEWFSETFAAARLGGVGSPQVAEMIEFLTEKSD